MKSLEVKKLAPLERFLYFVRERNQILLKRRAGYAKPWSDDEVLQSYSFTNVRREDDKVTIWFRDNIREPLKDKPEVLFATIAFRWFNLPVTGATLIGRGRFPEGANLFEQWNLQDALQRLTLLKQHNQVFTGAFNISNAGSTKPKINQVCEGYIQPVWEERQSIYDHIVHCGHGAMSRAFAFLQRFPGLGGSGFMAGQVICDLAYTHVLENAPDWWTFCTWGPGSKRGMNRVLGNSVDCAISQPRWKQHLDTLQTVIEQRLGLKLHARDVQSCLCEFSKYECGLWNDGHIKRKYPGRA